MVLPIRASLVLFVAVCAFSPRWTMGQEKCPSDFIAAVSFQILDRSTQIPIDNDRNNWNGTIVVRADELIPIEVWGYRVDLRFRNAGEGRYEVGVILQERTSPPEHPPLGVFYQSNATYKELTSTALKYEVVPETPLVTRPDIGKVTLDLTVYPYPNET